MRQVSTYIEIEGGSTVHRVLQTLCSRRNLAIGKGKQGGIRKISSDINCGEKSALINGANLAPNPHEKVSSYFPSHQRKLLIHVAGLPYVCKPLLKLFFANISIDLHA